MLTGNLEPKVRNVRLQGGNAEARESFCNFGTEGFFPFADGAR